MAKKAKVLIKLISSVGTGCFYTYRKSKAQLLQKISMMKYDRILGRHVLFNEAKLRSGNQAKHNKKK